MADAKISALPSATTPLAGTETLPVVQSGATKKVAVSNLTLGRTMQASAIASSSTTIGTVNNAYTVYYSSGYSGEGVIGDFAGYTGVKFYDSGTGNLEIFNKRNNATVGNIYFSTGATPTIRFKVKDDGDVEASTGNIVVGTSNKGLDFAGNGNVLWRCGSGTPEGNVTAPIGSLYTRTDGGAGTTLYVKESGTGNTGWVAK